MEIIKYDTVTSVSEEVLRKFVNKSIKEGWQPFGGIAVCVDSDFGETYSQALVKYKEKGGFIRLDEQR